jgi:transposase, IS30 family
MPCRLQDTDREQIFHWIWTEPGISHTEMGRRLDCHRTTVSRELARNNGRDSYSPVGAQQRADQAAKRPKPHRVDNPELKARLEDLLKDKYSPAGIARILTDEGMAISHETIYQAIYQGRLEVGSECLHLKRKRRRHRHQPMTTNPTGNYLGAYKPIKDRPSVVCERCQVGHWEGDLIVGAYAQTSIVTLYERVTRLTHLIALPNGKTALAVSAALTDWLLTLPPDLRRSLTWDRGAEMAHWQKLEDLLELGVYFADPHAPWQRAGNEQNNGILRRWFPKGTSLADPDNIRIPRVLHIINNQPRRSLHWKTPNQAINTYHQLHTVH